MRTREEIAQILREIKNLPTLPGVATTVIELSNDPEVSPRTLADTVECDPAIATRLLKLVNSPYFGIRGTVVSIHQALVFLGVSNLRNLVLSTCVMDLFSKDGEVGSFSRSDLWLHSIATAITSRELAKQTRTGDPEVAFTAGLIHDVGKVVLDRYFHEEFRRIVELMDTHHTAMVDAEIAVIGMDHAEVGFFLTQHWSLPLVLQEAVGYHHSPRRASQHQKLAALIGYADHVVRQLNQGNGGGQAPALDEEFSSALPLPDGLLDSFCRDHGDKLIEHIETLANISHK